MLKASNKNFISGLVWNYGSVVFLALGGLVFSAIIIAFYDASTLGNFNVIYAWYLLFSQLSVFGIHASVTRYTSRKEEFSGEHKGIFSCAMVTVLLLSTAVTCMLFVALVPISRFSNAMAVKYMWTVLPALPFFSLNKVILGYLNGLSKMRSYAVFQSLRNIFIAAFIALMAIKNVSGEYITLCFFFAEVLLFIVSFTYLLVKKLVFGKFSFAWVKRHLHFGFFIMPGNLILEFNSKIDVICLSLVLGNPTLIGYYTFASLFAEGFYQLFVVIRRSLNPKITRAENENKLSEFVKKTKGKVKLGIISGGILASFCLVGAFCILCVLMKRTAFLTATLPLVIIVIAIGINGYHIVFGNILSQTGYPNKESVVNIAAAASNFFLNLVFIYFWGLIGAAIATAISYFVFSFVLQKYAKQILKISL